jgi:hypothetical protein
MGRPKPGVYGRDAPGCYGTPERRSQRLVDVVSCLRLRTCVTRVGTSLPGGPCTTVLLGKAK